MESRKRNHPHTRKEWEGIRPRFTELYQRQGQKLSKIVEILGNEGFHAKQCHYKTHIKTWGLDRKNKQDDMIFAVQKLKKRGGKDTVFKIRGQRRSHQDVERYWKRKGLDPSQFSEIANTPPGVEYYRTPSPFQGAPDSVETPQRPTRSVEAGQISLITPGWSGPSSTDDSVALSTPDFWEQLMSAYQSTGLRVVDSPGALRGHERALHCAKIYIQRSIELINGGADLDENGRLLGSFSNEAWNVIAALEYHQSEVNAEVARTKVSQLIPALVAEENPQFITFLLGIMTEWTQPRRSHKVKTKLMTALTIMVKEIVYETSKRYGIAHPLVGLLQETSRSFGDVALLSEQVLISGRDIVARGLGDGDHLNLDLTFGLFTASTAFGDWNTGLQRAEEVKQMSLAIYRRGPTDNALWNLLLCQVRLADCHRRLGNWEEGNDLIENGLAMCRNLTSPQDRDVVRTFFLSTRGVLRFDRGQLAEALESFTEALSVRLKMEDTDWFFVAQVADWIKVTEMKLKGGRKVQVVEEDEDEDEAPALDHAASPPAVAPAPSDSALAALEEAPHAETWAAYDPYPPGYHLLTEDMPNDATFDDFPALPTTESGEPWFGVGEEETSWAL